MQSLHGISSSSEAEKLGGNRSGSPGVKGLFDEVISGATFLCFYQVATNNITARRLFIVLKRLSKTRKL